MFGAICNDPQVGEGHRRLTLLWSSGHARLTCTLPDVCGLGWVL